MKDIIGYESLYAIDEQGNIWSYRSNKYIKHWICKHTGYVMVRLHKNSKAKNHCLHRLLAKTFIENPNNYETVDHIDRDKLNNDINNLRWASRIMQAANQSHDKSKRITSERMKINNPNPPKSIYAYKNGTVEKFDSIADAAEAIVGDRNKSSQISMCLHRKKKTCRGYTFSFVSTKESVQPTI